MAKLVSKVYGDALFETAMEKSADRKRREGCLITSGLFRKDCGGADGLLEHHC